MKKLVSKAICSVAAILAIVFSTPNDLKTSERGLQHIANLEGCRTKAYQCSADVWTAGIGHTSGIVEGVVLTHREIANNFILDVSEAEKVVNDSLDVYVTQSQFDVLVSFVFNLGRTNFINSTMLKKFNHGDPVGGCKQFMRWVYVNGKNCNIKESNCSGIIKRRQIEQDACLYGW